MAPAGRKDAAADGSGGDSDQQEEGGWGSGSAEDGSSGGCGDSNGWASDGSWGSEPGGSSDEGGGPDEEPEAGGDGTGSTPAAAAAPKAPRRRRAAARAAADGAPDGSAKPPAAAKPKPRARTKKGAHRQNFKRHKTNAGGYGFRFVSKSAAQPGRRPFRRVVNGKLLVARRRAPHMAGQGAEYVEGFAGASGGGAAVGKGRCFKCGQAGHWEADCPLRAAAVAAQEAELAAWMTARAEREGSGAGDPAAGEQPPPDGGLAAAAPAPQTGYPAAAAQQQQQQQQQPRPMSEGELRELAALPPGAPWAPEHLSDGQLQAVLRGVWGHERFRGQQLPLVRAALQGRSMLGVLPTGLGKSLTYQMPALLLQGLVVVVSPLLALMRDQLSRLPPGLPGAMLQGSMTRQEVLQVLGDAEEGRLRVLYVAPEKLSAAPVMALLRRLSPLPLVCVDEAHCMAEWGQGFRPAYFRLGHVLRSVLRPRSVLALTATATPATRACIADLLGIPPEQHLVESPLRDNLRLQVVHANGGSNGGIAARVVELLTTGELASAGSAVVYAGFKASADALAAQLQRAGVAARPYHAGLPLPHREAVQSAFLAGALRVVVATVAFGMGVDKQDLDAVLHTVLPSSLEAYVQQVGRAGRDGRTGRCVLFLDDAAFVRLRALAHSNAAPRAAVERLLLRVFGREEEEDEGEEEGRGGGEAEAEAGGKRGGGRRPAAARRKKKPRLAPSQHRAVPLEATCEELDLSEEVVEGCLSFLQADPEEPYLAVLPNTAATLDVRFHRRPPEELAPQHPVVAAMLAARCRKYAGTYKVHMPVLLSVADRPPGELLAELSDLAAAREVGVDLGRQGALAWRLERQPSDWGRLVDAMAARLDQVLRMNVARLDRCYCAAAGAAVYPSREAQERHLRAAVDQYFLDAPPQLLLPLEPGAAEQQGQQQPPGAAAAAEALSGGGMAECVALGSMPWGGACPVLRPSREALGRQMRAALRCVGARARDLGRERFTGLAFARMLAGVSSPGVPGKVWAGCGEWGRLAAVDFPLLAEVGEAVVAEFWAQLDQQQQQRPGGALRTLAR